MTDDLYARLTEAAKLLPVGPVARTVRVGWLADMAIRAAVPEVPPRPVVSPIDRLCGLDIFVDETLDPDVWQVRDQHGNVMGEGRIGVALPTDVNSTGPDEDLYTRPQAKDGRPVYAPLPRWPSTLGGAM